MQPFSLNFYLPSEEVAISAANYNYNHYNLPFSHIMIIVIISDEDMLVCYIVFPFFDDKNYWRPWRNDDILVSIKTEKISGKATYSLTLIF